MTHRAAAVLLLCCGLACEAEDEPADGAVDAGDAAAPCPLVCAEPALPDPRAGQASFAPPGCDGGSFRLSWWVELETDLGASVPLVTDLDADGEADLVANPEGMPSAVVFFRFSRTPRFLPAPAVRAGGFGIDVGDFGDDGAADVVAGDREAGAVAFRNDGDATFTLVGGGLPSGTFAGAGLGDLDGDGSLDAVFGPAALGDGFAVAFADGSGGLRTRAVTGLGDGAAAAATFAFADMDGDEDLDVIAFGESDEQVAAFVFENQGDGTAFVARGAFGHPRSATSLDPPGRLVQGSVGDLDCDGVPDIAVGGSVFLGDGTAWTLAATADDSDVSQLGDLDGDGDLDLVTHGVTGLRAYRNDGTGASFSPVGLALPDESHLPPGLDAPGLDGAFGIDLADADGDGDLDVVRSYRARSRSFLELWTRR